MVTMNNSLGFLQEAFGTLKKQRTLMIHTLSVSLCLKKALRVYGHARVCVRVV